MLISQKKTVFFFVCLFVFSVNVLVSSNTFARFDRHEPNTPQASWAPAVAPVTTGTPAIPANHVAYFRDDAVAAVHMITGATAGETWTVEVLQPKKADGTPGGPVLTPAFPTVTYSGGCFLAPRMASVCGSPNWGIRWFISRSATKCQQTGTWTFNLKNNGVIFKTAYVDILPEVGPSVGSWGRTIPLLQYAENQGKYPTAPYDSICHNPNAWDVVACSRAQPPTAPLARYSIQTKGCAIAAAAMVSRYHRKNASQSAFPTAVNIDNQLLAANGGYTPRGGVIWEDFTSTEMPTEVAKYKAFIPKRNDAKLRKFLCTYGPAIVKLHYPNPANPAKPHTHFAALTGIINEGQPNQTWRILDPNGGVETTLAASKYDNNYYGIRQLKGPKSTWESENSVRITVYSPAELFVTGPQGRRVGYDRATGSRTLSEIPDSGYDVDDGYDVEDPDPSKSMHLTRVPNGLYHLDVIGTGTGTYELEFSFRDINGARSSVKWFKGIPITPGAVHTYTFNYSSAPGFVTQVQGGPPPAGGGNAPPVANAGPNQAVECSAGFANAILNGAGSSDPNGDPLTYSWSGPFGMATGPKPVVNLPLGTHTITLTVNDGKGGTATATTQVTVQDTTPPVVSAGPNVTITATGPNGAPFNLQPTVSDACCTTNVVITPQLAVYPIGTTAITATATDCAGNTASSTMQLTVQAAGAPPVPPGPPAPPPAPNPNPAPNPGNGGGQPGAGTNPPPPGAGNSEAGEQGAGEVDDETEHADEDHAREESKKHGHHRDDTGVEGLE